MRWLETLSTETTAPLLEYVVNEHRDWLSLHLL